MMCGSRYLQTITIRLYAVADQKLANPNRAFSHNNYEYFFVQFISKKIEGHRVLQACKTLR
jgi:hypothetical protein